MSLNITTIDFAYAVRLLVSLVKDFGPAHRAGEGDSGCTYFVWDSKPDSWGGEKKYLNTDNLRPVCIVGQVFARLGIARALITPNGQDQYSTCTPGSDMWENAATMGVTFTEAAQNLLRQAQYQQDSGKPWSEAVTLAVTEQQEQAVAEFKSESETFRAVTLADMPTLPDESPEDGEPLAEWEKDLLGG